MATGHETVKIKGMPGMPERAFDIDRGLASLIALVWELGLGTEHCCQEARPGEARIVFSDTGSLVDFLFVAQCGHPELETWDESACHEDGLRYLCANLLAYFPVSHIPAIEARFRKAIEGRAAEEGGTS
jgi:hypothetical protein